MADEAFEPRHLNPFTLINRGEDTVDEDGNVQFADFSPRLLPADVPDEVTPAPKDGSAQQPARSPESVVKTEQETSGKNAPAPADEAAGNSNPTETGKPASSSAKKTG